MRVIPAATLLAVLLAGCASPSLPYRPDRQPLGARVSADYTLLRDVLRVAIDTDGRQLQDAYIATPKGDLVRAQTIEFPPLAPPSGSVQVGVGFGGGSWGYGGGVGVGTGVSVGAPIGEGRSQGPTVATFTVAAIGPGPWELRIKLAGLEETAILLGEARPRGPGAAGGSR